MEQSKQILLTTLTRIPHMYTISKNSGFM